MNFGQNTSYRGVCLQGVSALLLGCLPSWVSALQAARLTGVSAFQRCLPYGSVCITGVLALEGVSALDSCLPFMVWVYVHFTRVSALQGCLPYRWCPPHKGVRLTSVPVYRGVHFTRVSVRSTCISFDS